MAKVKPLADRVLVEAAAAEETTKGGLYIPDTAKEKPQRGKIIAVGTGRVADDGKVTPLTVKVGDEILYGKYSGTELSLEGKELSTGDTSIALLISPKPKNCNGSQEHPIRH
ncbi:MAG: co-chaperone GroES [Flavobacteriales bacterium]|nr:co-chaperone GroES [Flavobacteriales bacterium]